MKRILIILLAVILAGTFFAYYFYYQKGGGISSENSNKSVISKTYQEVADLGFFYQNLDTYDGEISPESDKSLINFSKTYYKYYSYGEIPSGKYQGFNVYIVERNVHLPSDMFSNYTSLPENEVSRLEFIAVKNNKFVSYEEYSPKKIKDIVRNKENYIGHDKFPLPFKDSYQVDDLNTLNISQEIDKSLIKRLKENQKNTITKLDIRIDGYDVYELKNIFEFEDYKTISVSYFIDVNGVAIFYNSSIKNINYIGVYNSIPSTELKIPELKFKNYQYLKKPCSSELINLSEINPDIVLTSNLERIKSSNNANFYKIKDISSSVNSKLVENIQLYFYTGNSYENKPNLNLFNNLGLLVYQDGFGVYRGLVQSDSLTMKGGCGKPVIYLYPEKDTKVSLSFLNPIQFSTVIPNYENNWEVLAKPNGILNDLKPELTNCLLIENRLGSEYAKEACVKNEYPYLYWSGNTTNFFYPDAKTGFIVKKENLDSFFNEKLSLMNLNNKEISDFKEYWVVYLNKKKSDYFRISFFQNEVVDKMFPMGINPKPISSIRIFMDWDYSNRNSSIKEQKLISHPRTGFTLVEWGGLKK